MSEVGNTKVQPYSNMQTDNTQASKAQTENAHTGNTQMQGIQGLTSAQVQAEVASGNVNVDASIKTRSLWDIFRDNICTLFNFVNVVLAVLVFITGSYKNMLFMVIIIANVVIGIVQEIRSKAVTDKLSIVAASDVEVVRDGSSVNVPVNELVLGDVMRLGRGDQIPADAVVVQGECKVNESLLTGESKLIQKDAGSQLMSGSFINSGSVWARVEHVGADNYAAKITNEAKQHKAVNSEIMTSLNKIVKYVSIMLFPVGALLFCSMFFLKNVEFNAVILSTVSALVGMIPEGLILLTSTVLAVAVIRLSQSQVLVQQLYCIETLARVDTLCLDKTGTITTGGMEVSDVQGIEGSDISEVKLAFASIAYSDEDPNETANAIRSYFKGQNGLLKPERVIPFSSDVKWSGAQFEGGKAYVMGAAQFVLANAPEAMARIESQLEHLAVDNRVLLLARVDGFTAEGAISGKPQPIGFICIRDEIRPTAAQTIKYFIEQGVRLKVISGDDPQTVSGIAQKVGVPNADKYIDATTLETDQQIAEAIEKYSVFGRVRPEQKKAFVQALQAAHHTVAMTGDGVNDVLALKASDCSVAMAAGSDAARNVAQLVLVDNDFASMPKVVAEGRRSINNLQRSASLFLVKTLFSITLALIFIFLPWQYPFMPIQMTLISAFTIGLPSFVLALEPNHDRVRGRFLANCIVRSIPGAICVVATILCVNVVGNLWLHLSYAQLSTICVLLTAFLGVLLVIRLSVPFTPIRGALLVVVIGGLIIGCTVLARLFNIAPLTGNMLWVLAIGAIANFFVYQLLYNVFERWNERRKSAI